MKIQCADVIQKAMVRPVKTFTVDRIVSLFRDNYINGSVFKDEYGKYIIVIAPPFDHNWHHVRLDKRGECYYWESVMRQPGLGKGESFIPIKCMNCWKVVVRPRTVKDLFVMLGVIKNMDVRSKAGIETRPTVNALYGVYFYCDSINEGLERYNQVIEVASQHIEDIDVLLKRGCTEYEVAHGDSKYWKPFEGQGVVEEWIRDNVRLHIVNTNGQEEDSLRNTHAKWLQHAYACADNTYLELTDGKPLYKPYRTYHTEVK